MKTKIPLMCVAMVGGGLSLMSCSDVYYDPAYGSSVTRVHRPGHVVTTLPRGYRTVMIGGNRYYRHNDVYYRPRGSSYVVVDRPHFGPYGDRDHDNIPNLYDRRYDGHRASDHIIRTLPRGYRVVNHRGINYYRSGNTYYRTHSGGYIRVRSPF